MIETGYAMAKKEGQVKKLAFVLVILGALAADGSFGGHDKNELGPGGGKPVYFKGLLRRLRIRHGGVVLNESLENQAFRFR